MVTRSVSPLAMTLLMAAAFLSIFDLFVVNVALPSLQDSLEASLGQAGLVVAAYELSFGMTLISSSRLGDRYGRRRLFGWGVGSFSVASALCGLAPEIHSLILARILQGATAALMFPQVYAILRVSVAAERQRSAFACLGACLGLAALSGQVLGGWLLHADLLELGWRMIFLINVPIGLLILVLLRHIPESREPAGAHLTPGTALALALGVLGVLLGLLEGPARHWPVWSLISLLGGASLLILTARREYLRQHRGLPVLLDMQLLLRPDFRYASLLVILLYSTAGAFFISFALLSQQGLGLTPMQAGLLFAPANVMFMLASLTAPLLVRRLGNTVILAGGVLHIISFIGLAAYALLHHDSAGLGLLRALVMLLGIAQGLTMTPLLGLLLSRVSIEQAGPASGLLSTLQQVGAALGVCAITLLYAPALSELPELPGHLEGFLHVQGYAIVAAILMSLLLWRQIRPDVHGQPATYADTRPAVQPCPAAQPVNAGAATAPAGPGGSTGAAARTTAATCAPGGQGR
ncbi:MFS transporter [Alcaligenes sp. SDU_A2]|uniref:MFS transporter n=1 Tax=Alcaligenes sp. SDU_A2 TaxID=3136634 RepID=UPI00311E714E